MDSTFKYKLKLDSICSFLFSICQHGPKSEAMNEHLAIAISSENKSLFFNVATE